ncbi:MAG: hypothetical protein ACPIOQ_41975 [Promethearchaeia archaeon]
MTPDPTDFHKFSSPVHCNQLRWHLKSPGGTFDVHLRPGGRFWRCSMGSDDTALALKPVGAGPLLGSTVRCPHRRRRQSPMVSILVAQWGGGSEVLSAGQVWDGSAWARARRSHESLLEPVPLLVRQRRQQRSGDALLPRQGGDE